MDERRLACSVIQGVGPAAVSTRRAGEWLAAHPFAVIVWIDDRCCNEAMCCEVVVADEISGRIERRGVLDQVERCSVWRDSIEAEVALKLDPAPWRQLWSVDHRERRRDARER